MLRIDNRTLEMSMVQGDTGPFTVGINNTKLEDGDIINFSVKSSLSPNTPYSIQKKVSSFNANGKAEIIIEPDDTKDLDIGEYYYDIEWTTSSGEVNTLMPNGYASFVLKVGVTNE